MSGARLYRNYAVEAQHNGRAHHVDHIGDMEAVPVRSRPQSAWCSPRRLEAERQAERQSNLATFHRAEKAASDANAAAALATTDAEEARRIAVEIARSRTAPQGLGYGFTPNAPLKMQYSGEAADRCLLFPKGVSTAYPTLSASTPPPLSREEILNWTVPSAHHVAKPGLILLYFEHDSGLLSFVLCRCMVGQGLSW